MEEQRKRYSRFLKPVAKVAFSAAALYYVFGKIDLQQTKQIFASLEFSWLIPAAIFFILSKVASSIRLNIFFKTMGLVITERYNLRLYAIGMYYNLFLPGGIGGDGYKVYLLNKQHEDIKLKSLISATLLDRIAGLYALVLLAGILGYFLPEYFEHQQWLISGLVVVSVPAYYVLVKVLFSKFIQSTTNTVLLSFVVQGFQVVCAYFILLALQVKAQYVVYQFVFLISSIVAVFPFTVGGVGARELTFVLSHDYLGIDQNVAVAFSLLFFLITAITSLAGAFLSEK
ncbi:MAG: lysylphosphatidylglycerol synthase transmembrane domain-containing protein [Cyclobacteriaceae bacterium]